MSTNKRSRAYVGSYSLSSLALNIGYLKSLGSSLSSPASILSGHNFGHSAENSNLAESGELLLNTLQAGGLGGERGRNRTFNLLIKSQLLCQLSYAPAPRKSYGGRTDYNIDSGPRPAKNHQRSRPRKSPAAHLNYRDRYGIPAVSDFRRRENSPPSGSASARNVFSNGSSLKPSESVTRVLSPLSSTEIEKACRACTALAVRVTPTPWSFNNNLSGGFKGRVTSAGSSSSISGIRPRGMLLTTTSQVKTGAPLVASTEKLRRRISPPSRLPKRVSAGPLD